MGENISANDFCRYIWKSYLENRRYDFVNEFVSGKVGIIGTGVHEIERDLHELTVKFIEESHEWAGRFVIRDQWYQTIELSDSHPLVMEELVVREDSEEGILYGVCSRFVVVLEKSKDRWEVVHIHQSVADPNQTSDEFFPRHMAERTHIQIVCNLRHDSLTGLLNRSYFKETCERFQADGDNGAFLIMGID